MRIWTAILPEGATDLSLSADQLELLVETTSLVVVISDFLGETEDVLSSIYRLSGHELVIIQVLAPEETELAFGGDVKFVDLETRQPLVTRVTEEERKEYQRSMQEHN